MDGKKQESTAGKWLSRLAVLAAALLLTLVFRTCRPAGAGTAWAWLERRAEQTRQAFSTLTEALGGGENAAEAFAESYRVFSGGGAD